MLRKAPLVFLMFYSSLTFSQTILVDDINYSSQALVDILLSNSCSTNSNVSISSNQSVAYFNGNNSIFPIQEGIIIRSGIASYTQGTYTGNRLDSQVTTNGDADLQNISNQSGQTSTITDAAYLQFDFVPYSTNFKFDLVFASNEYGQWQCGFSDIFAFILTDLTTGETKNLAVLPNTDSTISVRNIRDNQYNSSCTSINSNLFSTFNVNNPSNSSLNMKGHTVLLNASADVLPGNPYSIKLVIGDYYDNNFDSAVLIKAGSFDTFLNIGENQEICLGEEIILDSGFTNTNDFTYEWLKNGVILETETNPTLIISEPDMYDLIVTNINNGCSVSDKILISSLQTNNPIELLECYSDTSTTLFNLSLNDHIVLGLDPSIYDLFYYASPENAINNNPIDNSLLINYPSSGDEKIFIRFMNIQTGDLCTTVLEFKLKITNLNPNTPNDFSICRSDITIDINSQVANQILNGLNSDDFSLNYFLSESDAINASNEILNSSNFLIVPGYRDLTIWVKFMNNTNIECFEIINFKIDILPTPQVDDFEDFYACTEFTLPLLINGSYFTEDGGSGTQLNNGDVIDENSTIYIYNENRQGCFSESNFDVYMADEFTFNTTHCEKFIIPTYPNALFYTSPDGPNGIGSVIPAGSTILLSQTIYFYVDIDGSFCLDTPYEIVINPLPTVEERNNVITCNTFTLPAVSNNEKYFTESNANGVELFQGDQITFSDTIFLWKKNTVTGCVNQRSFDVTIIDLNSFQNIQACGEYSLPNLSLGGYFTEPIGGGISIPDLSLITNSQIVYFYAPEVTTANNCTDNTPINITINRLVTVDSINNIITCEDNLITLQPLTNGNYFTESSGNGTPLFEGNSINSSQKIYIYNTNGFCDAESSFNVEIRAIPLVDNFTDVFSCQSFTLPILTNGQYFSEANGEGVVFNAGDIIDTNQTIYIYNKYIDLEGCSNENVFNVNILKIEVDQPADVSVCDAYELPPLTTGNYYTETRGMGTLLNSGDLITTSQTIFVFGENGERFSCYDENSFTVSIFEKPELGVLENLESCESVTLPILDIPGVQVDYYRRPNKADLIDPAEYTITELGSRIIYVNAYPIGKPSCFTESLFQVTVNPLEELVIEGGIICINSETGVVTNSLVLSSGIDPTLFEVNWFLEGIQVGTGINYNAIIAGTYTVETVKLTQNNGTECNYKSAEVVVNSSSPIFEINILTNDFSGFYTVEVDVIDNGLGYYEYSLDTGPFQNFTRFYNVEPGIHTIKVRDKSNLCGDFSYQFTALNYPRFFTPNEDGINDSWNIKDLRNIPDATIKIFTRLGRLVSIIKPNGLGWNGNNNLGKKESGSDYWFIVEYIRNGVFTEFRGNFSMLRK